MEYSLGSSFVLTYEPSGKKKKKNVYLVDSGEETDPERDPESGSWP